MVPSSPTAAASAENANAAILSATASQDGNASGGASASTTQNLPSVTPESDPRLGRYSVLIEYTDGSSNMCGGFNTVCNGSCSTIPISKQEVWLIVVENDSLLVSTPITEFSPLAHGSVSINDQVGLLNFNIIF